MHARTGRATSVAVVLAAVALFLPPAVTARWLAGDASPLLTSLTAGFWFWKLLLLGHAGLLWVAARSGAQSAPTQGVPAGPSNPESRESRHALLIVLAIAGVGLVLRLIGLDEGLWFDEIKMQVRYMAHPLGVILTTYDDQNQHLLYSVCAKLAVLVFGDGGWVLRLPAVLFGVASLWALYAFGARVTRRSEAVMAAALLAVSYHHVWFSQDARGYTGLLLWTLVSSALFLDLLRNRDPRRWTLSCAYGATIALALYTHLTAVVLPVSHVALAGWALWGPGRADRRPASGPLVAGLVLAGTFSLQAYAPVLSQVATVLLEPSLAGVTIAWKSPLWLLGETLGGLSEGVPGGLLSLIPVLLVGAVGLGSYVRRSSSATLAMLLPLVATAVAIMTLGHNLWPRFFFFGAGFAVLIGLRGLGAIAERLAGARGTTIATVLAGLAAIGSLTTVPSAWRAKQDYDGAEAFIDMQTGPDDAVVVVDMAILPFEEYKGRGWNTVRDASELEAVEAEHDRTWLIYSFPTSLEALQPDVWYRVQAEYRLAGQFGGTVRGGDIFVMVRP